MSVGGERRERGRERKGWKSLCFALLACGHICACSCVWLLCVEMLANAFGIVWSRVSHLLTAVCTSLPGPWTPRDPPVSASHLAWETSTLQASAAVSSFYLDSRDSNSSLHTCREKLLHTEPSPLPPGVFVAVLKIEPWPSCMLGKCSASELCPHKTIARHCQVLFAIVSKRNLGNSLYLLGGGLWSLIICNNQPGNLLMGLPFSSKLCPLLHLFCTLWGLAEMVAPSGCSLQFLLPMPRPSEIHLFPSYIPNTWPLTCVFSSGAHVNGSSTYNSSLTLELAS